jgi:glycosyltransferase involved in cell wall biosynthesis
MIKIIHLITDLDTGGSETMLYRLLSNFSAAYENIVISMTDKGIIGSRIESLGIKVYTLNTNKGIPNLFAFSKLLRIVRRERPAIMQTWLYHADLFGLFASKLSSIPLILWNIRCSCVDTKKYSLGKRIVLRLLIMVSHLPAAVIANSKAGMDVHKKIGYRASRWEVINNGFDVDFFCPKPLKKNELKNRFFGDSNFLLIGSVARFDQLKDHENLLKAIKAYVDKYTVIDNVKFVLVGSGTRDNPFLQGLITAMGIENKVITLGERDDIPDIMSSFDIYCSSSSSEGFPNSIGESMACGVPCVSTDAGDSAFLINKSGIIVPTKDPEALARAWNEMISLGEEERHKLGLLARKRIETDFSIRKITRYYEALYSDLITSLKG